MTNRFFTPSPQFLDEEGLPETGGKLWFYLTNSDTPHPTYEDYTLSIANANPVVLNALGEPEDTDGIFLDNVAYKVVLTDADDNEIWTRDPVWSSDFSTYAAFRAYNGNPNGLVAGNAATVGTMPGTSVIWDYVNNILYVCTTSGDAATAVWTAINEPVTSSFTPGPTGYLTPTSGTPVIATDAVSVASILYTPYTGNTVPIYNGTTFTTQTFTELTLSLTSSQAADTLYDVFVFNNAGVLTLVTGPAWINSTAGSCDRGTGAATTEISRISGIWTNTVQITGRNGATTYTIGAGLATYLGSLSIDSVAGQVSCYRSWGQNRKWGIWNAYNRVPIYLKAGDATATWNYGTNTLRPSNNDTDNKLTVFTGLPEEVFKIEFLQYDQIVGGSQTTQVGIGWNSTTVDSGKRGIFTNNNAAAITDSLTAQFYQVPSLGINNVTALEAATALSAFNGTERNMVLSVMYMG